MEGIVIPDDESSIIQSEGFLPSGQIDSVQLDMSQIVRLSVIGSMLLVVLILSNFLAWRRYSKSITSVLSEMPAEASKPKGAGPVTPR
mmetsp:Transcript_48430/g.151892  ORF Transcript_48430/g.151892 Transcript_48430/m.151892 type:complete len:88 (-) Transcript_48430:434-697(-)